MLLFTQHGCIPILHHINTKKAYENDLIMGINEIITLLRELCHVLVIYIHPMNREIKWPNFSQEYARHNSEPLLGMSLFSLIKRKL